jgi:hypothetical protein
MPRFVLKEGYPGSKKHSYYIRETLDGEDLFHIIPFLKEKIQRLQAFKFRSKAAAEGAKIALVEMFRICLKVSRVK